MNKILCFFLGHKWKFYKRWRHLESPLTPELKELRQWRRCVRCPKRELVASNRFKVSGVYKGE